MTKERRIWQIRSLMSFEGGSNLTQLVEWPLRGQANHSGRQSRSKTRRGRSKVLAYTNSHGSLQIMTKFIIFVRRQSDAKEFYELVVLPLWARVQREIWALDITCAVVILLDQMVDWIAEETGETPPQVRDRLKAVTPQFGALNLVSRALKHREVDRGPHKGLRDVFVEGRRADGFSNLEMPCSFWPDQVPGRHPPGPRINSAIDSISLLAPCIAAMNKELGVDPSLKSVCFRNSRGQISLSRRTTALLVGAWICPAEMTAARANGSFVRIADASSNMLSRRNRQAQGRFHLAAIMVNRI